VSDPRQELYDLYARASEQADPEERERIVRAGGVGRPELEAELRALLARFDELLERSASLQLDLDLVGPRPSLTVGTVLDGYRIEAFVARGGMGEVYRARQEIPRRTVALKVVRAGSPAGARFRREIEIQARLAHPGIAAVYGAGVAECSDGRWPYLAMEFVDGKDIAAHVEAHRLPLHDRLRLLLQVCHAIEHAHAWGCIHRDLKPSNILVDAQGRVRVLDFGIARLVGCDARDTELTREGDVLGTLAYMSPEQVRGSDGTVDGRTDVYALGVLGYLLVAGVLPLDVAGLPFHVATRRIGEDEPIRLGRRNRRWRGDLEVLVSVALDRDPARRYPRVADLSRDLERYLSGEPIEARPVGTVVRARRALRKHRLPLLSGAALALGVLLVALWVRSDEAVRAYARARRAAEHEERLGRAMLLLGEREFSAAAAAFAALLVEDDSLPEAFAGWTLASLRSAGAAAVLPRLEAERDRMAREPALARLFVAALQEDGQLERARSVEAGLSDLSTPLDDYLRGAIALHAAQARPTKAAFETALAALRRAVLASPRPRSTYYFEYAQAAWRAYDAEAAAALLPALERHWPDSPSATYWAACCAFVLRDHEGARARYERVCDRLPRFAAAWANQGLALGFLGRHEEAATAYACALELDPARPDVLRNLTQAALALGRVPEALDHAHRAVLAAPLAATSRELLARALWNAGQREEAAAEARAAAELAPADADRLWFLGDLLRTAERWDEAAEAYLVELALRPWRRELYRSLALVALRAGRPDLERDALELAVAAFPRDAQLRYELGVCLSAGDPVRALGELRRARALAQGAPDWLAELQEALAELEGAR